MLLCPGRGQHYVSRGMGQKQEVIHGDSIHCSLGVVICTDCITSHSGSPHNVLHSTSIIINRSGNPKIP